MKINYINISLLIKILLISVIIIIYHSKKYYLDEMEEYSKLLFNLDNKDNLIEEFKSYVLKNR